jgi:hypothetical protein
VIIRSAGGLAALIDAAKLEKALEIAADSHDDCRPSARSDTPKTPISEKEM